MEINKPPQVQSTPLPQKKYAENAASKGTEVSDSKDAKATEVTSKQTAQQTSKQLMNQAILSAQQDVNIKSGDQSMALLYRAAIESINKELAPTMGENAIQTAYDNGVDTSPEATADRIVSFATQFFSIHQQQNSGMSLSDQLDSFMGIIGGAIDNGFKEAKDILSGLKVLQGDIADGVDKTYSLVQEGLQAFRDSFNKKTDETASSPS
ncbi:MULTISPECIES: DUF5610 domain-containing protein [Shewanella]|jgi:hypothetical protein|uniref:DUF5610 domain-containing protein n=2 Tax=Shewanella TaxID=22 RepID=A0ABX1KLC1_9GAMM|nr:MULTISPECIES: DUF5610 domain-containing protein [Shewanella]MBP7665035.1 DUF5610 domain-containing protein [Shewanella sp.]MCU8042396.1 DUF5610 domain-containing protein [Shewanella sp. SM68]MCU8046135.1 DUF5610 domain-containing protein [Shewanella sp. SM65]MCU8092998.1 DUF5610 domain-containing protein [Shewanella sp. SM20]MCU8103369.1 DUF5610 domain-containing protein [Shewanella sp. SM101]